MKQIRGPILFILFFVVAIGGFYFFGPALCGRVDRDRVVSVQGVVYEWVNAPVDAESQLYFEPLFSGGTYSDALNRALAHIPEGVIKEPIDGINIKVTGEVVNFSAMSDNTGKFLNNQWVYTDEELSVLLTVEKQGYLTVTATMEKASTTSRAIVVLMVKEK